MRAQNVQLVDLFIRFSYHVEKHSAGEACFENIIFFSLEHLFCRKRRVAEKLWVNIRVFPWCLIGLFWRIECDSLFRSLGLLWIFKIGFVVINTLVFIERKRNLGILCGLLRFSQMKNIRIRTTIIKILLLG